MARLKSVFEHQTNRSDDHEFVDPNHKLTKPSIAIDHNTRTCTKHISRIVGDGPSLST